MNAWLVALIVAGEVAGCPPAAWGQVEAMLYQRTNVNWSARAMPTPEILGHALLTWQVREVLPPAPRFMFATTVLGRADVARLLRVTGVRETSRYQCRGGSVVFFGDG